MYENDLPPTNKYEVRGSCEVSAMKAESIPKCVSDATDDGLRNGPFWADSPHELAALIG
jgi:hypothetical protein